MGLLLHFSPEQQRDVWREEAVYVTSVHDKGLCRLPIRVNPMPLLQPANPASPGLCFPLLLVHRTLAVGMGAPPPLQGLCQSIPSLEPLSSQGSI